jgi:hypothetical protein
LARCFSGSLPWNVPIEIKQAATVPLEPLDLEPAAGPRLVLLKFEEEGDPGAIAIGHS